MITVEARNLVEIRARIRELGDGSTIPREIGREIRSEVPPLRQAVERAALAQLPHRGGLNAWVAASKVRASIRYGARSAGVRLVGSRNGMGGRSDLAGIDQGTVWAPSWGRRSGKWHTQQVPPGYFSRTLQQAGTERMGAACERAIRAALVKLGLD